jgi:hypothetical protein
MNKRSLVIVSIILIIIGVSVFFVFSRSKKEVATQLIDINRANIISQDGNAFKIKLDFKGDGKTPRDIVKYYVSLYQSDNNGDDIGLSPIDIATYDDQVILAGKDMNEEREILYYAPGYLKGKYVINVDYVNEVGVVRESIKLGSVDLMGNNSNFLEIFPGTCKLSIAGEPSDKKYDIIQGVDVKSDEDLVATCTVMSHFNKDVLARPNIVNFKRKNFYAESPVVQEDRNQSVISFKPNELKDVSFSIPKALIPQAYDAEVSFFDEKGGYKISTASFFHYVLAGEGASIQSVILDKGEYKAGESANVNLSYFGSSDMFSNSRHSGTKNEKLAIDLDIRDVNNESCLSGMQSFNVNFSDGNYDQHFDLNITKECKNPFVKVILRGGNGMILDDEEFLR